MKRKKKTKELKALDKEKLMLLIIFSSLNLLHKEKKMPEAYMTLFRKLNFPFVKNLFALPKLYKYFNTLSISRKVFYDDELPAILAILIFFFNRLNTTKRFSIKEEINQEKAQEIFEKYTENLSNEEKEKIINYSISLIEEIYPDFKGLIEFYKLSKKFPFCY